ncbi:MAG: D-2-hydroxyacid dehydrogenase [Burkholderiales bacterium]|nr:D-2-hydroxyacid dehydrogenase [Burkholderiales bacterium]
MSAAQADPYPGPLPRAGEGASRRLSTFAFLHPIEPAQLQVYLDAFPGVEFLQLDGDALPQGLERAQAGAISWVGPPVDDILAAGRSLQWLHQRGAGIDRIATPALVASDVLLTNGSGNHAINIAEHVLGLMLAFARQFPALLRAQGERRWTPPAAGSLFELSGQTLAVIGAGALGCAVAERAAAFGMRVHGVRRSPASEPPPGFVAMAAMDALDGVLREADHVVITLPLTAETRGLFSTARIAAMKPGAHLYNVGRGAIVDQGALLEALRAGHLAGAGLDVTDPEPLPADSPLWAEPGVVITAHSSGLTPRSYARYQALLLDNLGRFMRGEELLNLVDKRRGY